MSSPTTGHDEQPTNPSSPQAPRAELEELLYGCGPADWNVVVGLLRKIDALFSSDMTFASACDDPFGRSIVSMVIARNPPACTMDAALQAFPDSLRCNPVAFFTACRFSTPQIVSQLMRHVLQSDSCCPMDTTRKECPYPWVLSSLVSVEGAKTILQLFPQGVLQESPRLSNLCPLDFFLMSPEMIRRRKFDMNIWTKFKLMLVAAECCEDNGAMQEDDCYLSPVHVILGRVLSRPDILGDMERARHILWLLHQLRCSDRWIFERKSRGGLYPLHFVLSRKCAESRSGLVASRELVKLLLASHPASARYRVNGRLAIHMAVENGWPCHDLLLSLFPEALDMRDPVTGFVPFQSAASSGTAELSLNVTFELFRANPSHVDHRLPPRGASVGAHG